MNYKSSTTLVLILVLLNICYATNPVPSLRTPIEKSSRRTDDGLLCNGIEIEILRTYKYNSIDEGFEIKDADTGKLIYSVPLNSGQPENMDWTTTICVTSIRLSVTPYSARQFWAEKSYLFLKYYVAEDTVDILLKTRYDEYLRLMETVYVSMDILIPLNSDWYYNFGTVPANWSSSDVASWRKGAAGGFPDSPNQLQLYKRFIEVPSLDISGFVIHLRYRYGCIIMVNNKEVFRNGVEGELTASSFSTNHYEALKYRRITLSTLDTDYKYLLKDSDNVVAIALVSDTTQAVEAEFECFIRILHESVSSRVLDAEVSVENITGDASGVIDQYYKNWVSSSSDMNSITLTFPNDARETINTLMVQNHFSDETWSVFGYYIEARNGDEKWTRLGYQSISHWENPGDKLVYWIRNVKPYNQYRFLNIQKNDQQRIWVLNELDMMIREVPSMIPQLQYPASKYTFFVGSLISRICPSVPYYSFFMVTTPKEGSMPAGLSIDLENGCFMGIPEEAGVFDRTIIALSLDGSGSEFSIRFAILPCEDTHVMINLKITAGGFPQDQSWELFYGNQLIAMKERLSRPDTLLSYSLCVPRGVLTLNTRSRSCAGWDIGKGFMVSTSNDELVLAQGMVPAGMNPVTVESMFNTDYPLNGDSDKWRVLLEGEADPKWTSIDFDDSRWELIPASSIESHQITSYMRTNITLTEYFSHVLNIAVKFTGGLAVYFNGHLVARFNLPESFDSQTYALGPHAPETYSSFSINLDMVREARGVLAMELHQSSDHVSVTLTAIAAFTVGECSILADSVVAIEGSDPMEGELKSLFDNIPWDTVILANEMHSFVQWEMENLEGSFMSHFGIWSNLDIDDIPFVVTSTDKSGEVIFVVNATSASLHGRTLTHFEVSESPLKKYRFEMLKSSHNIPRFSGFSFEYCVSPQNGYQMPQEDPKGDLDSFEISLWSLFLALFVCLVLVVGVLVTRKSSKRDLLL